MSKVTLSRFTPSLLPHEMLERLFVARERTLEAILARIDAAVGTSERNHTLLVGPRGSGKTHLLSLVYHRVSERRRGGAALQVAWLPEDPWTIVSYRHLLAAIAESLEPRLDDPTPKGRAELESLLTMRAQEAGPIVVLIENLDQVLAALEDEGQQRLRHLLQNDRSLLLVATSTRLDRTLSDHASPFYGFFTTSVLAPFDLEEAAAMLTAIAREQGDEDLVAYLETREAQARLRTIMHLAGGQPRIWAALATALSVRGLDELVDLLLTRFDDLTPYYQEQLGRLSPHQRLVVAELAELDRPINVSELAERVEIDQRSLAKTMKELVDRGWAQPTTSRFTELLDRRRTYYELAEPLARLSFQLKESRGEPVRLVVDFLKHWFDPKDFGAAAPEGLVAEYVLRARHEHEHDPVVAVTRRLERLPVTRAPTVALLGEIDDALGALMGDDPEPLLRLPAPIRRALEERFASEPRAEIRIDIHLAALAEFGHVRHPAMEAWIARAEHLVTTADGDGVIACQLVLANWLGRAWMFDEAEQVLAATRAAQGADEPGELIARAGLAASYQAAGRVTEAIELWERLVEDAERIFGRVDPATITARANLAVGYRHAGRAHTAIDLLEIAIADQEKRSDRDVTSLITLRANLAACYADVGRTREAIEIEERVVADRELILGRDHPDTLAARANLAVSYDDAGRTDDAVELEIRVSGERERVLGPHHPDTIGARANLAVSHLRSGRVKEATELLEAALADFERILGHDHPRTLSARANLASCYYEAGLTRDAIELLDRVAGDRERILGHDHPDTLAARANLAASYAAAGRRHDALELEEAVLADLERTLGLDHPDTLSARANLAVSYHDTGRVLEAIGLEERVVADRERVLGRDHPDTLLARANLAESYDQAGRTDDAMRLMKRALADCERVFGSDHPKTVAARKQFADFEARRS